MSTSNINYEHYLPVVLAALTVVLLGCWNPKALRASREDVVKGVPSYKWLALLSLLVGMIAVWCYNQKS